ncbi:MULTISPECIES: carbohydrate ABC transporter permease [Avibacterium]|uniref:Sugar ABC transporter permease n=3 Tax=Avibacterium TaxID=292486 RepID=A0A0F5ERU3_AVIPA|nr:MULTISPECIES: sugar ABC transporter permease [Avibacterium]AZI14423.1 sugar ABC transporter permease [Avibacterium paragallinarum]MEE3608906.1 sugar ABC transporter permease [Avibacterium paragallinarum]MEE3622086.1 sugar ABC transporter permease [Avibacterium paragallinarum]MEE3669830.1 sugar ABC transporter permease [Avibacterium paragallinarum]MEE3680731.1 sugar ABC transporter permease [Avibacterium paragallinarum]
MYQKNYTRWIFVLPAMIVVSVLFVYPFLSSIFYSFTNKNLIMPNWKFVGFDNYIAVINDPNFWLAFSHSILWTLFSLVGQVLVGFALAMALHRIRHLQWLYKILLIIPWAFPTIVIAFSWQWILNGVYGYLPNILVQLNLMEIAPHFLSDSTWAFISLVFINVWFGAPLIMVNVLSALQTVPQEQYEAAKIDGANAWQVFRHITLPHIKVVIGLLVVLRTVWVFNNFDIIYLITGGGPANSTMTLPIYAYNMGWGTKMLGRSSAVTVLLFLFLLLVCFIYFKVISRWEKEGE